MPTYVAQCDKCNTTIEYITKIADRDSANGTKCPFCEDGVYTRIMTTVAFGDPIRLGITRPDAGMKEVLQRIQEKACGKGSNASVVNQSNLTRL